MNNRDNLNDPVDSQDRLGELIRRAYRPPERDRNLSIDLTSRILSHIDQKPPRQSWYEWFSQIILVPPRWVPVGALACLVLGLSVLFFMNEPAEKASQTSQIANIPSPSPDPEQDPLGSDFFTFEKYDDEPITVDLADGWDAMTIEDDESNTALVYFYSAGEVKNSTGGVQ